MGPRVNHRGALNRGDELRNLDVRGAARAGTPALSTILRPATPLRVVGPASLLPPKPSRPCALRPGALNNREFVRLLIESLGAGRLSTPVGKSVCLD